MPADWELWAVAHAVLERHGVGAPAYAASRIELLSSRGDQAGVEAWRRISRRMEQLAASPTILNS